MEKDRNEEKEKSSYMDTQFNYINFTPAITRKFKWKVWPLWLWYLNSVLIITVWTCALESQVHEMPHNQKPSSILWRIRNTRARFSKKQRAGKPQNPNFPVDFSYSSVCMCACARGITSVCPLKPVPSGDPGVQNECLGSGHLGQALPSVSQICFLTHEPSEAGNQMVAQLGYVAGVRPSVKAPLYDTAWSRPS